MLTLRSVLLLAFASVSLYSFANQPPANHQVSKNVTDQLATISHAIAMHGEAKYPANFSHFDYVNPNATKGGSLTQAVVGNNFDSLNPYIVKGVPAAGLSYLYQTLMTNSSDEASTEYGLIAEKIEVPNDRSWVTFYINPKARFDDGSPIQAQDVEFSFKTLTEHERALPFFSAYYGDVTTIEVRDPLTIHFAFKDNQNKELPLILGQMPIFSKAYWSKNDFGKASLTPPVGNGPYKIASIDPGRAIVYQRNPNYWAKDLAVNKGRYNFDNLVFEYYKDNTVALEAFKAGEYDFRRESTARNWANAYVGKAFDEGELVKEEVSHERPAGLQAFVYNTRRSVFADAKVREALNYAFDFEWTNKNLFNQAYQRSDNYFENSELASEGLPTGRELEILKHLKSPLPASVFTQAYQVPKTQGKGGLRKNLRTALKLLKQAGWQIRDKKLSNAKGEVLSFEFLLYQKDFERVVQPFIKNLSKLGVQASIRVVDTTQYINRLREFDYDIVVMGFGQSESPGNEQRDYWHSSKASQAGSRNYAGIQDPAVDELIELIIAAPSRKELVYRTRALDRVLLAGHYVIPNWYNPVDRIAYRSSLKRPDITPRQGIDINTWWQ